MRGGFIQKHQGRIPQKRPRQRHALRLATGKPEAAFADQRIQPLRQVAHKIHHLRGFSGGEHGGIIRIRPREADIFAQGRAEQMRTLPDIG